MVVPVFLLAAYWMSEARRKMGLLTQSERSSHLHCTSSTPSPTRPQHGPDAALTQMHCVLQQQQNSRRQNASNRKEMIVL